MTFWVALDPVVEEARDCSTSLLPSTFKSALVPVHLLALAIVSAAVWSLGAVRSARMRPGRPIIVALAWGALLLGIPASLSYAWLRGADPFCF